MRPTLPPGTLIVVHQVPISTLKVGEIITYENPLNPRDTISHRIIKEYLTAQKVPTFITKGDANKSADVPVVEGLVQGKVTWHVRDVGWLLIWARSWLGIFALIYIPSALIILEEILRLNEYFKHMAPYRLFGYTGHSNDNNSTADAHHTAKLTATGVALISLLAMSTVAAPTVFAMLRTNTVTLTPNELVVAKHVHPQPPCSSEGNNSVSVHTSTLQNANTGDVSLDGKPAQITSVSTGDTSNDNSVHMSIDERSCS